MSLGQHPSFNAVWEEEVLHRVEAVNIVVLQAEDRTFGLVVDDIHDTEEIVVKPLSKQFKGIPLFAGATIMGGMIFGLSRAAATEFSFFLAVPTMLARRASPRLSSCSA